MNLRGRTPKIILAVLAALTVLVVALLGPSLRNAGSPPPGSHSAATLTNGLISVASTRRNIRETNPAVSMPATPATAAADRSGSTPTAAVPGQSPPSEDGQISPGALREIAFLEEAKAGRTPAERKMDSQLVYADRMRRGLPIADNLPTQRVDLQRDTRGRVLVDIKADVTDALLREIETLGGRVINSFPAYHAIRAGVPLADIETLAARPDVRFVQPALRALRNTVVSEGDTAHQASAARAMFGVDGTGVKVGVLSDSVDYLSSSKIAGLVTVVTNQSGLGQGNSGEGTAMLEIVHDLAPGAQLYFATAAGGEAQFATNILQLRFTYGCDIIVDDYTYADESPFQDGIVAQAVNAVTASGGLYFSSAANSGNLDSGTSGTWEGDFVNGGAASSPVDGRGGYIHSFGPANYDTVTQGGLSYTVLFWSDPLGASTNDYDLFVLDSSGTTVVSSSVNYQTGTQDPFEYVAPPAAGERLVVVLTSGVGRFLHLDTERGRLAIGTPGSTRGHNAATNGFCVAAVAVTNTIYPEPFSGGSQDAIESFSSDGPRRMFYYPDGAPITPGDFSSTGGVVYQKPDFTAADKVTTDVPAYTTFGGTSAAAPHAAAIAALLKSYDPSLSVSGIRAILTGTALDIMAPGTDRDSGAGIPMALAALQATHPDALGISPSTGFTAGSPVGGPCNAAVEDFALTNAGNTSLNWDVSNTSSWLNVSSSSGTLAPDGAATTVTVSLNVEAAEGLSAGAYYANLSFTNLGSGLVQDRLFTLVVQAPVLLATYPDAVLSLKPFAYWRLNETNQPPPLNQTLNAGTLGVAGNGFVLDGVGRGEPGVISNSFRFYNPNLNVAFFGSRVDVPYQPALNPSGAFTVEFWVKPAQLTSDLFCPLSALDLSQDDGYSRMGWIFYQAADNTWQFRVGGISGYTATADGGTAQAGVWQHIAGVYDGTNITLYVDGQPVDGPWDASGFSPNTQAPFRIGATTIPNRGYDGWIDEVAFFSRALSAAELAAHYDAASTNSAGYGAQILAADPTGYWPLDDTVPAPNPALLPVAFNSGSASNVYGLYEPGSQPGAPGVPFGGFGISNTSCQFDGVSGYIDIPGPGLNFTGPVTVLAWIKAGSGQGVPRAIISGGATSYRLLLDASGYPDFSDGLQIMGDLTGVSPVDDGQWHQLAGVYDGAASEVLYVDGQPVASTVGATVPVVGNDGDVWIGGAPDYGTFRLFDGVIDEVAIFTNALTVGQIQQLYAATNAPPRLAVTGTNGVVTFTWDGALNRTYQLQYKTNLSQPTWLNLGDHIVATNATPTTTDEMGPDPERFYRIALLPP